VLDYAKIRKDLECANPLIFFHDDPDGLSSFLLIHRYLKKGLGIVVKSQPKVDQRFVHKIEEIKPDKVIILDLAIVEDEFLQHLDCPVIWIDHHQPQEPRGTHYYNPRLKGKNIPVSLICYNVVKQDLWIAVTGIVADWHYAPLVRNYSKKNPSLIPPHFKDPGQLLFDSQIGKLARIFSFILKGPTDEALKCVRILTRIESAEEILERLTPKGNYIYKRFELIEKGYHKLLSEAVSHVSEDRFVVFTYDDAKISFTGDLSNELLYRFPGKVIVIGRIKSGEVKCSFRGPKILAHLQSALVGIKGYGGGHEEACGGTVAQGDFSKFIQNLRQSYNLVGGSAQEQHMSPDIQKEN